MKRDVLEPILFIKKWLSFKLFLNQFLQRWKVTAKWMSEKVWWGQKSIGFLSSFSFNVSNSKQLPKRKEKRFWNEDLRLNLFLTHKVVLDHIIEGVHFSGDSDGFFKKLLDRPWSHKMDLSRSKEWHLFNK
jgi:hypothetical protein